MPKIFISYRREDSESITGRIHENLSAKYGPRKVYIDTDNQPASDFRRSIGHHLKQCQIVLAIVGPKWLGPIESDKFRIHDSNDWVRIEIETAMQLDLPIVPVLVEKANMPSFDQLPVSMRDFAFRHAVQVNSGADFRNHYKRLVRSIDRLASKTRSGDEPEEAEKHAGFFRSLGRVVLGILIPIRINRSDHLFVKFLKWTVRLAIYVGYIVIAILIFGK